MALRVFIAFHSVNQSLMIFGPSEKTDFENVFSNYFSFENLFYCMAGFGWLVNIILLEKMFNDKKNSI